MSASFQFGPFSLDPSARSLQKGGADVAVGSRAFDILVALVEASGKVLGHRELMAIAWPGLVVEEANVRIQVAQLRKALGERKDGTRYIASVARRGYCFVAEVVRAVRERGQGAEVAQGPRVLSHMPAPLERPIGREESVGELTRLVAQWRLVSVVGPGGSGKTTVAVLAAHALESFGDAIFFVDLSLVKRDERVLEALASAVGFRPSGSVSVAGLAEFMGSRTMLLVLDNCEHVVAATALLCKQLREQTRNVSLLCTSREALRLTDEHVYLLRPLASPPNTGKLTAAQTRDWPAVQLFVERAQAGGAREVIDDENAASIAAICRRMDGNPLAIELVASRVATFGVQGVSELLASESALHWRGRRDAAPRHQTVEAMLDWTYDLLPLRDRVALHRLSVFSGSFPIDAAIRVLSDTQFDSPQAAAAIADLADKSLVTVRWERGGTRLRLLETTRAYAAAKLGVAMDRDTTARRHAAYYAEQLRPHEGTLRSQTSATTELRDEDLDNVRAAMDWCFSAGDHTLAVEMSALAAPLLLHHRLLNESERCCERALGLLPEQLQSTATELTLLESLAVTHGLMARFGDEVTYVLRRGLALSRNLGDDRSTLYFSSGLYLTMLGLGRFNESLRLAERYVVLAESEGDATDRTVAAWMMGTSLHFVGKLMPAVEWFETARLTAASGLRPLQYFESRTKIMADIGVARTKWALGLPEQALQLAWAAIEQAREQRSTLFGCVHMCFPIFLMNDLDAAAEALIQEVLAVSTEYRVGTRPYNVDMVKGLLLQHRGRYVEAEAELRKCLPGLRVAFLRFDALQAMAEVLRTNGKETEALSFIDEAILLAQDTGAVFSLPDLMRTKAEVMMVQPEIAQGQAQELLAEALQIARQQGALGWEVRVELAMATDRSATANASEARAQLKDIYARFTEGHDTPLLRAVYDVSTRK